MNLLKKYKNLSAPVKASLWFLICGFLQKGVSMITTPIFTRLFTPEQFGVYSVYQSWHSIVSIIAGLNLAAGVYTRGLVKNEDDQDRFSSSMLGLSLTSSLICMAVYYIFNPVFNKLLDMSMLMMSAMFITIILSNAYTFWANRERVNFKYKKLALLTVINVVANPVFGVIAVMNSPENLKVEARVLTIVAVDLIIFGWIYFSIFRKGKTFYHKQYWKYAIAFNLPLIPHYLSQIVLSHSDRIMISNINGDSAAGLYSVAYSLAYVMHIFNSSVSSTMNPWIYKSIKKGNIKEIGKVSYLVLLLLAVLNLALIIFAPEIMMVFAAPEYASAVWVIPPVAASVFFMFMYNMFATFEYYYEKTKFVMLASVISAALNIALNYVFLNMFKGYENGYIAAAYTTLVCYIISSLAHYLFMRRVTKKELNGQRVYDAKIILAISLVFSALAAGTTLLYPLPLVRYALLLVMGVLAFVYRKPVISMFKKMKKKD